jgi:hypothetical protein
VNFFVARTIALLLCSSVMLAGGCRRPAYQEVYVQNMAAEIRELEDIIYEYDHEFRKLELELENSKRENQQLKKMATSPKGSGLGAESEAGRSLLDLKRDWQGRESSPGDKPPAAADDAEKSLPKTPENKPAAEAETPKEAESSTPLKSLQGDDGDGLKLEPSPAVKPNEDGLPAPPAAIFPGSGSGANKVNNNNTGPGLLEPPVIDLGTPTDALPLENKKTPAGTPGKIDGTAPTNHLLPPPTLGTMDVELGRIPTVVKGRRPKPNNATASGEVSQASFESSEPAAANSNHDNAPRPLDQRLTEITFVRPFSIALDLDGEPGDDAVRLVLQPRNSAGEFLEQAAELTVSAIDPEAADERGRLGMWNFKPEEVMQAMRRQGNAKGIHLDLSLDGKIPMGKRVMIFVRYQMPDGRRVESSYEYVLGSPGDLESKWLPRASANRTEPN